MNTKKYEYLLPAGRTSFGIAEVAALFSHSAAHFQNLIKHGELKVIDPNVKPKTRRRVSREELLKLLIRRMKKP